MVVAHEDPGGGNSGQREIRGIVPRAACQRHRRDSLRCGQRTQVILQGRVHPRRGSDIERAEREANAPSRTNRERGLFEKPARLRQKRRVLAAHIDRELNLARNLGQAMARGVSHEASQRADNIPAPCQPVAPLRLQCHRELRRGQQRIMTIFARHGARVGISALAARIARAQCPADTADDPDGQPAFDEHGPLFDMQLDERRNPGPIEQPPPKRDLVRIKACVGENVVQDSAVCQ